MSQLRGEICTKARLKVRAAYDLKPTMSKEEMAAHIAMLTSLKTLAWVYEDHEEVRQFVCSTLALNHSSYQLKGFFCPSIFAEIIGEQWFGKKKDGQLYGAAFNPLPAAVLALVGTAVWLLLSRINSN